MPRRKGQEASPPAPSGTAKCGWCITGDHQDCKPYIEYYGQKWHCPCDCKEKRRDGTKARNNQG